MSDDASQTFSRVMKLKFPVYIPPKTPVDAIEPISMVVAVSLIQFQRNAQLESATATADTQHSFFHSINASVIV